MIDYVIHHVKANGKLASIVFRLMNRNLMAGETIQISKRHSFRPISTRKYYAGEHKITIQISRSHSATEDMKFFDTRRMSEAIILEKIRPVLLVRDGLIEKAMLPEVEAMLKGVRKAMVKPVSAVGRIELADHDSFEWCGTGWRIDEDLIVTNRHVAELFAQRHGRIFKYRLNQMGKRVRARIDFREEYRGAESEEFGIAEILWIADDSTNAPDIAILKVKRDPGLPPPLKLAGRNATAGQQIGVVGYPAKDSRNGATIMADIFQDIYDVKRFAPGEVVTSGEDTWYLTHDASTLGGNSGSAVLALDSREVVGLHFGGSFRKTNYAVKASVIKSIIARRTWMGVSTESLRISTEGFSGTKRSLASMQNRAGYQANFLARKVALPKPGRSHEVLRTNFPSQALPYTHFSIVMSKARRFPTFTAENVNGALKIKLKRKNTWGFDPRIPNSSQVSHAEFYGPEAFDKGHMVRRENPGWGHTPEEAKLGEHDSFVYTNAIPQMPQLNQRTWLSLEDYVLDHAKTEGFKIAVFTGPVFRSDDPDYNDIQVPQIFGRL